jgi:hypothetical protein
MSSDDEGVRKHEAALEGLVLVHARYLRDNPGTPPLSGAGVSISTNVDDEPWMTIPAMLRAGRGDAEDVACWRAAELRAAGKKASVVVRRMPGAFRGYLTVTLVTDEGEVDLRDIARS